MSSLKCFVGRSNATSTALLLPSTPEGQAHHEATQDRARPEFRIEECGTREAAVSLSPAAHSVALINVVIGCVNAALFHKTYNYIYWDRRVITLMLPSSSPH